MKSVVILNDQETWTSAEGCSIARVIGEELTEEQFRDLFKQYGGKLDLWWDEEQTMLCEIVAVIA